MGRERGKVVIVLMGVSGSGKTTIGTHLAADLGWLFADGDDYHSPANVEKMRNGIPLTDADRAPWLDALRALISKWIAEGTSGVLACSALKQAYRDELNLGPDVHFVFLTASPDVLRARLHEREGHYMKEEMLQSQLATLELPRDAVVVDVSGSIEETLEQVREKLGLNRSPSLA
jgi:gluconokinase